MMAGMAMLSQDRRPTQEVDASDDNTKACSRADEHFVAPILRGVDMNLDTCLVKLETSTDSDESLCLVEVFHDNNPEFSSDTRVWECGIVLARILRQPDEPAHRSRHVRGSLLQGEVLGNAGQKTKTPSDLSQPQDQGTAVIDLGSGTGVVGLSAAYRGLARHVFLTEMPEVVPLLELNAELNAKGRFQVIKACEEQTKAIEASEERSQFGDLESQQSLVYPHALDWRETRDRKERVCRYSVTQALLACNERPGLQVQSNFNHVSIIASDCVYSPREVESFMAVLRGLADDMRHIPGVRTFELILAIKLRLYSETNRCAVVEFLGQLGEWLSASGHVASTGGGEQVWQSAGKLEQEVRQGNPGDDLGARCGLTVANSLDQQSACGLGLVLQDVCWKRRMDLFPDLKKKKCVKKIDDITIFRISSGYIDGMDENTPSDSVLGTAPPSHAARTGALTLHGDELCLHGRRAARPRRSGQGQRRAGNPAVHKVRRGGEAARAAGEVRTGPHGAARAEPFAAATGTLCAH